MSKKLLLVINHIDWFWSHRLPLAQGAQKKGWNVHVAVKGATHDQSLKAKSFTGHELPQTPFQIIRHIYKILKSEKPDVIHAITLKYAFFTGLAARLYNINNPHPVRIIHTIAGLGYLFSSESLKPKILRTLLTPILKLSLKSPHTHLIFQNPDDQALMIKRGLSTPTRCTLIRGSGVDTTQYPFTPLPETNPPIILMPTRLLHEKGVKIFIEAANIIQSQGINARFQIAGGLSTTNPNAITQNEMKKMLQGSSVEWLGKITNMPSIYQAATLICYPSYYGEGIPKVLLEAAATGRPIITTNHPGCREAVQDNINGKLIPIKDANATASAIIELLNTPQICQKMSKAARTLAEETFATKHIVSQTLKVYEIK